MDRPVIGLALLKYSPFTGGTQPPPMNGSGCWTGTPSGPRARGSRRSPHPRPVAGRFPSRRCRRDRRRSHRRPGLAGAEQVWARGHGILLCQAAAGRGRSGCMPVAALCRVQAVSCAAANARVNTAKAAISALMPTVKAIPWAMPCQLSDAGGPSPVPAGKPAPGRRRTRRRRSAPPRTCRSVPAHRCRPGVRAARGACPPRSR